MLILMQFSWGARFVCRQLSIQGTCRVGVVAHPSFLKETHVKGVQGECPKSPLLSILFPNLKIVY